MEWKEETEKVGHKDKIVKKKIKYISNNRVSFCSQNEWTRATHISINGAQNSKAKEGSYRRTENMTVLHSHCSLGKTKQYII